ANGDPSADAAGGPAIQALQGRWKHSDKQFGMLTVTGKRVCFEETKNNSDLLPQHDGSVTLDGWLSRPETLRPEVVEWTLGAAGCNGRCEWYRCDAKEDLEPSRAAGSPEAQRSILVFRKRNPEKRAAPPDDVAEVSQPGLGAAVAAIQGRWEHSSLGMLAVDGMQVVFDRGITCNIVQMPDGSLNVGGFVSRPLGAAGALEQPAYSVSVGILSVRLREEEDEAPSQPGMNLGFAYDGRDARNARDAGDARDARDARDGRRYGRDGGDESHDDDDDASQLRNMMSSNASTSAGAAATADITPVPHSEPVDSRVRDICRHYNIEEKIMDKLNKAMKTREDFDEDMQVLWHIMEKGARNNKKPLDVMLVKIRELTNNTFVGKDLLDPDIKHFESKHNLDDQLLLRLVRTMKKRGSKMKQDLVDMDERIGNESLEKSIERIQMQALQKSGNLAHSDSWHPMLVNEKGETETFPALSASTAAASARGQVKAAASSGAKGGAEQPRVAAYSTETGEEVGGEGKGKKGKDKKGGKGKDGSQTPNAAAVAAVAAAAVAYHPRNAAAATAAGYYGAYPYNYPGYYPGGNPAAYAGAYGAQLQAAQLQHTAAMARAAVAVQAAHLQAQAAASAHAGTSTTGPGQDLLSLLDPLAAAVNPRDGKPLTPEQNVNLKKQVEFYFSTQNLCKDLYLRSHMNEDGWTPLELISQFPQVRKFRATIAEVAEVLTDSTVLEVDKVSKYMRLRNEEERTKWSKARVPSEYRELVSPSNAPQPPSPKASKP
ncbi:unnamed protein product, partial [Polarella glacialis]